MINFFFNRKHDNGNDQSPVVENQEAIIPFHHEMNTSEGGEFLDDAIRMKEQPLEYYGTTEKQ